MSQPFKINGLPAKIAQIDNSASAISNAFIQAVSNSDEKIKTNHASKAASASEKIDFIKNDQPLPTQSIFDSTSISLFHRHPSKPTQDAFSDFMLGFNPLGDRGLKDLIQTPSTFHHALSYGSTLANSLFPTGKLSYTQSLDRSQSFIITEETQRNFATYPVLRSAHLQISNLALEKFDLNFDGRKVLVKNSFKSNPPSWAKKEGKEERKLLRQIIKSLYLLQNPKAAKRLCNSIANLLKFNGLDSSAEHFLKLKENMQIQTDKPAVSNQISLLKNAANEFFHTLDSNELEKHLAKINTMDLTKEDIKTLFKLKNPGNQSLFWVAAFNGMNRLLTLLLNAIPVDTSEQTKSRWLNPVNDAQASAFYVAVQNGHTNTVNLLLDTIDSFASTEIKARILGLKTDWGASALYTAVFNNHSELAKQIIRTVTGLKNFELTSQLIYANNHQGVTALHLAALNGNLEIYHALIQSLQHPSARLNMLSSTTNLNETPLMHAAEYQHADLVKAMCETANSFTTEAQFALLNSKNIKGESALYLAAKNGNMEIVKVLASVFAKQKNKQQILDLLEAKTVNGISAIQAAKNNQQDEVVNFLEAQIARTHISRLN